MEAAQTGPAWLGFSLSTAGASTCPCYRDTQEALWQALARGDVDAVGSDHVVAWPPADRQAMYCQSIWDCRTGFSRVETFLPVMLTHGVHEGRITLERLVQVSCENPARIYGLFPRKGAVAVGSDADLVVVDLSREVTVGPEHLNTRAGWSIMEGKTYHGWPVLTRWVARSPPNGPTTRPGRAPVGEPRGRYSPWAVRPGGPKEPRDRLVRTGPRRHPGRDPAGGLNARRHVHGGLGRRSRRHRPQGLRGRRLAGRPGSEPDRCCW